MSSLPYIVELEKNTHDLILSTKSTAKPYVVIEMKRWMSCDGTEEIPAIQRDLQVKLVNASAENKLMMLFSANPRGQLKENLIWLSDKLAINHESWKTYSFNTLDLSGNQVEFWTGVYLLESNN